MYLVSEFMCSLSCPLSQSPSPECPRLLRSILRDSALSEATLKLTFLLVTASQQSDDSCM